MRRAREVKWSSSLILTTPGRGRSSCTSKCAQLSSRAGSRREHVSARLGPWPPTCVSHARRSRRHTAGSAPRATSKDVPVGGSVVSAVPLRARPRSRVAALEPTGRAAGIEPYALEPTAEALFDCRPGAVDLAICFRSPPGAVASCGPSAARPGSTATPAGRRSSARPWRTGSPGHAASQRRRRTSSSPPEPGRPSTSSPGFWPIPALPSPWRSPAIRRWSSLLREPGLRVVGSSGRRARHRGRRPPAPRSPRLRHAVPSVPARYGHGSPQAPRAAALGCRSGAAIVEDDYDSEFRHTARPLEPLQRLDRDGRVIYVGTFSKNLSPALRIGFLVAPRTLVPAISAARQVVDWCPPPATQDALTDFIADGYLDQHLRRTRRRYTRRHRLMREALDRYPARRLPAAARCGRAAFRRDRTVGSRRSCRARRPSGNTVCW